MTNKETDKFLSLVVLSYPSAYRNASEEVIEATSRMWQNTFARVPYRIMELAFDRFRRKSKFPPTVAEMHEALQDLHLQAKADSLVSAAMGDLETQKKAMYIAQQTESFRDYNGDFLPINYRAISERDIKELPGEEKE